MPRSIRKQQALGKDNHDQAMVENPVNKKPSPPPSTRRSTRLAQQTETKKQTDKSYNMDIDDEPNLSAKPEKTTKKKSKPSSSKETTTEIPSAAVDPTLPVYFWKIGETHGYLSQWFPSTFTDTIVLPTSTTTHTFVNAEQYMMYRKALLFAPDSPVTADILTTTNPRSLKSLGRAVPNFDQKVWEKHRLDIVRRGNLMKFWQNEELKEKLLGTGERELVEASPMDKIWGVGFAETNAEKLRGSGKWGMNLLGIACMDAREKIRALEKEGGKPSESVKVEV